MYPIAPLSAPHSYVAAMIFRLFGKDDSTKFSMEWIALIDAIVNSVIMNWVNILTDNLAMAIGQYRKYRVISTRVIPPFFMSAYVMDAIYFCTKFPNMDWNWTLGDPNPMHVYHKILWEYQFLPHSNNCCLYMKLFLIQEPPGF